MSNQDNNNDQKETAVEKRDPTYSERFVSEVKHQFNGAVAHSVEFTDREKQLASRLFIKIDTALKDFESDRHPKSDKPEYTWKNINMHQLAIDAVHRVRLGLDALIDNHIHPVPYLNSKTGKYDLNLTIGYKGEDYYRRQVSLHKIKHITYELVHENDEFVQIKKDKDTEKDDYEFKITEPFNRGEVVGGFGYIEYEDDYKNTLVVVPESDFIKSKNAAPSNKFWNKWPLRMRYKTLVHRTTSKIIEDPEKVNDSYHYVKAQSSPYKDEMEVQLPEQPTADQRKNLDFNDNAQLNRGQQADDVDFEEQPEVEQQDNSTNGTQEAEQSNDQEEYDRVLANINNAGKEYWGTKWFKKSKEFLPEGAEYLTDLDIEQLREVKAKVEEKAKAEV